MKKTFNHARDVRTHLSLALVGLSAGLLAVPGAAWATQPPPRAPVIVVQPTPADRFQQSVQQQQSRTQQQNSQMRQQLHQSVTDTARRPSQSLTPTPPIQPAQPLPASRANVDAAEPASGSSS